MAAKNKKNSIKESKSKNRINRRDLMKLSGLTFLTTSIAGRKKAMADAINDFMNISHPIPAYKKLDPKWIESLYARGKKETYTGKVLETIGMPCCGIASGQLYLCGDGTLGDWQLFGNPISYWVGATNSTFAVRKPVKPVEQGFAVAVRNQQGDTVVKKLRDGGVEHVEFQGEYPVGIVHYKDSELPVKVQLNAFSPYIPLNAQDSAYPATIFELAVQNTSRQSVEAGVLGWLENAICLNSRKEFDLNGKTEVSERGGTTTLTNSVDVESSGKGKPVRFEIPFEDFEGPDWGKWKVEGDAFGDKPFKVGTNVEGQAVIKNVQGEGFVNTMEKGDQAQGKLTSEKFKIQRRYICFLLGGGGHAGTNISLIIDGNVVRRSTGFNDEGLHWRGWYVEDLEGREAQIVIEDIVKTGWGHVNVDSIVFTDKPRHGTVGDHTVDLGNMTFRCLDSGSGLDNVYPDSDIEKYVENNSIYQLMEGKLPLLRSGSVMLKPGEEKKFRFIMSWYYPNMPEGGRLYAVKFKSSRDVVEDITNKYQRLSGDTYLWRDMLYDSTLPYWLIDRLHSTMSTLATGTTRWWENGRFYAFEGCTCCHGTCTHVWSYAQGHARLFPEIGRNIREMQDFAPITEGGGFYPQSGLISFRADKHFGFAADGQCGSILNAYREHLTTEDNRFLEANWSKIKKALGYLITQDARGEMGGLSSPDDAANPSAMKDENKMTEDPDGIITGTQHNTYDINYHGANTLIGALYLAALRAGEEMAKDIGDEKFAAFARKIYENGRKWTVENLWNGEYFIQEVDLEKHKNHQYADGCLSDQLFGQMWAHQLDLGHVYPEDKVKKALHSIWKYNWAPDVGVYNEKYKPFRWFISPGQPGLITCTWPKGDYLPDGTMYKNEVWTGIEYQVAANLIDEGYVTEGLAICKAIHERYQPGFLNPYNEIECGDHYARALASWAVYLALAGYKYNGPEGSVGFEPKITPHDFKAAFTFANGWAAFAQKRDPYKQVEDLTMRKGSLKLRRLDFTLDINKRAKGVEVKLDGNTIASSFKTRANAVTVDLGRKIEIKEGQNLEVAIKL